MSHGTADNQGASTPGDRPPAPPEGGWRRFILAAYGPPLLSSIGYGAVTPLVVLSARDLGASVALSALIGGLTGISTMLGDLPASWVATKLGEKRAIIAACCWDFCWLSVAFFAHSLAVLSLAVFCFGVSGAVFGLARQTFITEMAPVAMRARALSSLGGTQRIGYFIGPLAGSAIVATHGLSPAYGFAAIMSLFAAAVTFALPDLPADVAARRKAGDGGGPKLVPILRSHARVYAMLGSGILGLSLVRAVRQTILPLWCEQLGMSDATSSLIFSLSMGVDMSLFFLGGFIMDRFGREWVALPSLIILGIGLASLSMAHHVGWVVLVAMVLGLGNGVGSGIVMTLGSDASPAIGRTQFLGGWRMMGDAGTALGPVALSGLTLLAGLAGATVILGGFACLCAAWLRHGITWSRAHARE